MLTTKFEPRDDVNRLLHPDVAGIRCIKPVQLCCKTLRSSNSYAGKTRQHRSASRCQQSELVSREHSARTYKYAQFPLVAVAESNKSQTNWEPYYNSFQLSLMTLLPADWCCKGKNDCPTKGALPRLNKHAVSLLESSKQRQ